jgi:hypothetical protein
MIPRKNYAPYILRQANDNTKAECIKCLENKNINDYYKHSVRSDGFIRYRQICKSCRKKPKKTRLRPIYNEIISSGIQSCLSCKINKPLNEFYKNGCFEDGLPKYRSKCKKCVLEKSKKTHDSSYPNKIEKKHSSYKNYISTLLNHSSKRKKDYNIDIQYLLNIYELQNGLCNISGVEMTYKHGSVSTNISIDRIDSDKGYIKGNIQLVCYIVNIMKNKFSVNDFLYFCNTIITFNNKKNDTKE